MIPNIYYFEFSQLCSRMIFSASIVSAAFSVSILHVFLMSCKKKMSWIYTGWIVAGMTHFFSFEFFISGKKNICDTMGFLHFPFKFKPSVSIFIL